MASGPLYAGTPRAGAAVVATANTNVDGTGTVTTVFSAGANGSRVTRGVIQGRVAAGSTQANDTVNIFLHDGTNFFLLRSIEVPLGGAAIGAGEPNYHMTFEVDWQLPIGWSLRGATFTGGATATYVVTFFGGDY